MKTLVFLLTASAFFSLPSLAEEVVLEPFEFRTPPSGTKVQWRNVSTDYTYTLTVRDAEPNEQFAYPVFTETGDKRTHYLFCGYCGVGDNQIDPEKYARLYPLEVGSKTSVRRWKKDNSQRNWTHKIRVTGTELVSVPFATDKVATFVIEEKVWNNQTKDNWSTTYWFAPSLANNVRITGNLNDAGEERTSEVIGYLRP